MYNLRDTRYEIRTDPQARRKRRWGEGGRMLRKVIEVLQEMGHVADRVSEFESYYANVQRETVAGGPTFDEARADYVAAQINSWRSSSR